MKLGLGLGVNKGGGVGGIIDPTELANLQLWLDSATASDFNVKMAAKFTAANSEFLSSASTDFDTGNTDFSMCGWFKNDDSSSSEVLAGKWNGTGNQRSFSIFHDGAAGNNIDFNMTHDGSTQVTVGTTATVSAGTWYFVAVVYDAANDVQKVSLNGAAFETIANAVGLYAASTADLTLGAQTGTNYYDGALDNWAYYDKALTLAEVQELYNSANGIDYTDAITASGTYEGAAVFDGTDDALVIDNLRTDLASTTTGTWATWVNFDATGTEEFLICFGDTNGVEFIALYKKSGDILTARCYDGGVEQWQLNTTGTIPATTWKHVALVQDGTSPVLYVDGVAVAQTFSTTTDKTKWFNDCANLDNGRLGCRNYNLSTNANFTDGQLDGVGIWSEAKTADQIADLYNSGSGEAYSGLAALAGTSYQGAIRLDGAADALSIDNALAPLASTTTGTWMAWVRMVDSTPNSRNDFISSFADTSTNEYLGWYSSWNVSDGKLAFTCRVAGVDQWVLVTDAQFTTDDTWTHVAIVQDGTSPVLYVNGVAVAQTFTASIDKTVWFSDMPNIDNGNIGCLHWNGNANETNFWYGDIDGVGIYNNDIDSSIITSIYNSGTGTSYADLTTAEKTNLVAWYDLHEEPNATREDSVDGSMVVADFTSGNSEYFNSASNDFDIVDTDMSFGCWVKFDSGGDNDIFTKYVTTGNQRSYALKHSSGNVWRFTYSQNGISVATFDHSTGATAGKWHFIVFAHDATNDLLKISVDGESYETTALSGGLFDSTADLNIGAIGATASMNGNMKNAFVYNEVLSEASITTLYDEGRMVEYSDLTAGQTANLVSWYAMDETSGNRADSHGSNTLTDNGTVDSINTADYDATVIGAPLTVVDGKGTDITSTDITPNLVSFYDLHEPAGSTRADSVVASGNDATDSGDVGHALGGKGTDLTVSAGDLTTSLVEWWDLNEISGDRVGEHAGHTLTDNNTVTSALGKVSENLRDNVTSATFDGTNSQYLTIDGVASDLAGTTTGTWSAWLRQVDATSPSNDFVVSISDADQNSYIGIYSSWQGNDGKLALTMRFEGTQKTVLHTDTAISIDGEWTHVAVVQDGVSPVLYVNGVAVAQTFDIGTDKTYWIGDDAELTKGFIGAVEIISAGVTNTAHGDIKGVGIWNTNFSAAEVLAIYDLGFFSDYTDLSAAQKTNLVSWYDLSETSGNRADSVTASGNTAVDAGSVTSTNWGVEPVNKWTEKSSNADIFTQDTAADQPLRYTYGGPAASIPYVDFDGTDFINIDQTQVLTASDTVGTFSAWINLDNATPGSNNVIIAFGDTIGSNEYLTFEVVNTSGILRCQLVDAGTTQFILVTDAALTSNDTWVHIAVVQNGVAPVIYVDGIAVAQTMSNTTDTTKWMSALSNVDNGRIGCYNKNNGGDTLFFNGKMKEVHVWSTALSGADIADIYQYTQDQL